MFIVPNKHFDVSSISQAVNGNLRTRLHGPVDLSQEEIDNVAELYHPLVPKGAKLADKQLEELRALAVCSRCEMKALPTITSHRPFIGPIIVMMKRILWPFLRAQLRGTLNAQQEFNSRLLYGLAQALSDTSARSQSK